VNSFTTLSGRFFFLAIGLGLAAGLEVAAAAESEQKSGAATLRLEAPEDHGGKLVVPLSGRLLMTVTVDGPPLPSDPYQPVRLSREWEVKPQPPVTEPFDQDRKRWQQTFVLEPRGKVGSLTLQLEPLPLAGTAVKWTPIPVEVTTEVAQADLKETRDVRPPEELPPPPPPSWPLWTAAGVGSVFLAALAFGVWEVRRRWRPKVPPVLAHEWAIRELDRIDALGLPAAGEVNRYHTLLSEVLRRYLEMRFQLPASRRTTAEFLQTIQGANVLSEDQAALLRDILERCDLAKFAPVAFSPPGCHVTSQLCRQFVEQTRPAPNRDSMPDSPDSV
jgi:hypothetical protein